MTDLEFTHLPGDEAVLPGSCRVSSGAYTWTISPGQMSPQTDLARQKSLFKAHVIRVVVETASYCNRRCVFCPNQDGSRLVPQRHMPDETYSALMQDLAEIEFSGQVLFHLYNEPLANPKILAQVAEARHAMPRAMLAFNSNGDYLKPAMLPKLAKAGLNQLNLSVYGPSHGAFEPAYVEARVAELSALCGFTNKAPRWINPGVCQVIGMVQPDEDGDGAGAMKVFIQAKNHNLSGYDRGGLVAFEDQETIERRTPCPSPFEEVLIGWNGVAVPCCNVVPDNPAHSQFSVGTLGGRGSVFAIYAGNRLAAWRRSLLHAQKHGDPCGNCTRLARAEPESSAVQDAYNAAVDAFIDQAVASPTD